MDGVEDSREMRDKKRRIKKNNKVASLSVSCGFLAKKEVQQQQRDKFRGREREEEREKGREKKEQGREKEGIAQRKLHCGYKKAKVELKLHEKRA